MHTIRRMSESSGINRDKGPPSWEVGRMQYVQNLDVGEEQFLSMFTDLSFHGALNLCSVLNGGSGMQIDHIVTKSGRRAVPVETTTRWGKKYNG